MFIQPEGLMRGTHQFQHVHTNRFMFSVDNDPLTKLICSRATKPNISFNEIEIPHINKYRYEPGRPRYEPLSITLYDYVVPSTQQYVSAWLAMQGEIFTGRMGYNVFYRRTCTLETLGNVGDVISRWEYYNCFIVTADFGEMSWENEAPAQINLSIRYDDAVLKF